MINFLPVISSIGTFAIRLRVTSVTLKYFKLALLIPFHKVQECFEANIVAGALENLPININHLDCSRNNISLLDNLPFNLIYLSCDHNNLSKLDNLPVKIIALFINVLFKC